MPFIFLWSSIKQDTPCPLMQGFATEETIWKQIDAIRMIAGSKRPPQPSCIEEVKALYLFVGIEPPVSFDECSDLEDVNDKLQFLKSIIGVK